MDMPVLPPLLSFVLLLGAFLAWICVPLIPAFMELIKPRDAAPLNAVGNDAGRLTFFADSYTQLATQEGLRGAMVPPRLSDGSVVRSHSRGRPIGAAPKSITDMVVLMDGEPPAEHSVLEGECLARVTIRGNPSVTYRALLGQRDILLGHDSTILRWVHARGRLDVESGTRLLGRATSDHSITLATDVEFDRLEAATIHVAGANTAGSIAPAELDAPSGGYRPFTPEKSVSMGPNYWRVTGDLVIPTGAELVGSVIATGSIIVSRGARVSGSIKAHGDVRVQSGGLLLGSCAARGRIAIEAGSRVSGPIISEEEIVIESATVGVVGEMTTVTAPTVQLMPGTTVHGAIMAADGGMTLSSS